MVAQELTPELTQPNVLVEIDHGPTMGPYQKAQRRVPMKCIAESLSIINDASASISTFSPAVEADGYPEPSVGHETTALTGTGSHGTKMKVLKGGSVGFSEFGLNFHLPSWPLLSKPELTILDTGEETAFIGMHLNRFIEVDNRQGAEPSPMAEKPTSRWSLPEGEAHRQLNSSEIAHAVVPALAVKEKDWAKPISARRCPQRSLVQDLLSSWEDPKSLLSLTDQGSTVSRDCALEYRHGSFNGDSNVDHEVVVICEKKMAGDDKSAVIGKPNSASQPELRIRNICAGRLQETQVMAQDTADDVKPPFSMSGPTGAKTDVNVDAGCIASEILMWMVEYNLMTSQGESQSLPRLSVQSTELLLNLAAIAVSCLHVLLPSTVERTARVRQCTEKVHCLLDDPG